MGTRRDVEQIGFYGAVVPSYKDVVDEIGSPGSVANGEAYAPEGA